MRFKTAATLLAVAFTISTFANQSDAQSGTSSAPVTAGNVLPSAPAAPSFAPGTESFVQPTAPFSPNVGTIDNGGFAAGTYDSGSYAQPYQSMPAGYGTTNSYFSGSNSYGPASISGNRPGCSNCGTPCPQQTFVPPFYGDTSPALLRVRRGGPANPGVYFGRQYGRPLFGQWCGF